MSVRVVQVDNAADIRARLAKYWAKADPAFEAAEATFHSVVGHSLDVAACACSLLTSNRVLRGRMAARLGCSEEILPLSVTAIVALHDVGKIDTRFQLKVPDLAARLRPSSAGAFRGPYDHGTEGFRQVEYECEEFLPKLLGLDAIPLLRAVCGHHGTLPSNEDPDPSRALLSSGLTREDRGARADFLRHLTRFFTHLGAALPWPFKVDGAFIQQLAGLCAVADWLGSNVEFFPYAVSPINEATYWPVALARAKAACEVTGLVRAPTHSTEFGVLFRGYSPRDVQLITESLDLQEPSLVVVEAAMGSGKTEAALALAARSVANGQGDGLFIGLPTIATSNAMFTRVESYVRNLYQGESVQLALAHGRASRQPSFLKLAQVSLRARDDDAPEASVSCARWLINRKRILLAQVGVGTVDQALQGALVVRHQFVRMFGLSQNVVLIDEVHAYDAYMEVLLEHLLRWLGALEVTVIVLSATLPAERRQALAGAWRGTPPGAAFEPLAVAQTKTYPLVTLVTRSKWKELGPPGPGGAEKGEKTIQVDRRPRALGEAAHLESVVADLSAAARSGARVAWIRNTVREAQDAMEAFQRLGLGADTEATLFHARFRGSDRAVVEQRVLDRFGKGSPPGGRVLIATQVVEQSLDLDFDELHSDLAPMDLLFQRLGRLHRHSRPRPHGFELPRLVVYTPSDTDVESLRFGPSQYVYDTGTLWLANRALGSRRTLILPGDIRALVEETYHPESRQNLLAKGGEELVRREARRANEIEARRTKARQCCIPMTEAFLDGGGALDDDEDTVMAFTRDGQSTTLLLVLWDGMTGTSLEGGAPWNLDASRPDAWRLVGELLEQTVSMPARTGVLGDVVATEQARWQAWRKSFSTFAQDGGLGKRVIPLPLKDVGGRHRGLMEIDGKQRRVEYCTQLGFRLTKEDSDKEAR